MEFRKANLDDIWAIRNFTDYWLSGRGKAKGAEGAVNDCFISPRQHKKYIEKYTTCLLLVQKKIVAWAVIQKDDSLIHFLIAGDKRGKGIGSRLLRYLNPQRIHSKSNQSSGDPGPFYEKHGYKKIKSVRSKSRFDIDKISPDREKIIDIYQKIC